MNIMRIERLRRAMAFMLLVIAVFIAGCGNSSGQTEGGTTEMTVTSENLHNGVWDDVITNTSAGENLSPELT